MNLASEEPSGKRVSFHLYNRRFFVPVPQAVPRAFFATMEMPSNPYLMRSNITPASMWWV